MLDRVCKERSFENINRNILVVGREVSYQREIHLNSFEMMISQIISCQFEVTHVTQKSFLQAGLKKIISHAGMKRS